MNQLHCCIFSLVLLSFTVCTCSARTVYGFEGQDINLPCKYDSVYHGVCDVCWMKGSIPNNGCGDQIIYANEKEVLLRNSKRYQLNGNLKMGDASLTIRNARLSDSGKYGCRVHIPGWFNDKKFEVNLAIRKAMKTTTTPGYVTTTPHTPTQAPVLTTHVPTTFPETTKQTETPQTNITTTPLIPTQGPVSTTQNDIATTSENATTVNTGPVSTTNDITTTSPEKVTTKHTGQLSNGTTSLPVNVTTKHTETPQTNITTTPLIPTQGPVSTTQNDIATTSENATTVNTALVTTVVNSENYPDESSMENNKPVKEVIMHPAILVPVILILLFMGIVALYLISKHKRRFRATLGIAKNSSTFVDYNNLENSVNLPMTSSSDNEMS
ncbi:hypothetical protein Q7C36_003348 [Tachysurus vachellii]|uniref:Ig-like domain-containing protein n=1 Tax=Tachysurus vachellii TaxID=175792 RepID=A0AA88T7B6_TACVA|nr:hepatitis A virus cellular receptor 1 homolog [Tachysurus vachellii]KAK2864194.1 hypothetical protein Q7C36_003348 [Tachysurus vachellii]